MMRYEWTPMNDIPDHDNDVIIWHTGENSRGYAGLAAGFYDQFNGQWFVDGNVSYADLVCWRDVEPPTEAPHTASKEE